MKRGTKNDMKSVNVNVDQMQVFVTINNSATKINADVNANNCLMKMYEIKDLFEIKVIANVNISRVLVSVYTMKTASIEKN